MLIALAVLCAFIESVFTCLEVALGAVPRARLRAIIEAGEEGKSGENKNENQSAQSKNSLIQVSRARRALEIQSDAGRVTLLFITVTSLSLWTAASLLTWQALRDDWPLWVLPLALTGVLFVAEVLPVLLAASRAEAIALRGAGLVSVALSLLFPLLFLVGGIGRAAARLLGARETATPQVTEDELRSALDTAEKEGAIESGERALIEGAMEFRSKLVREVMTTRRDLSGVPAEASLRDALHIALEAGHSRLPVYEGTLDKIIGIISTKDLIPHLQNNALESAIARDVARPAFFVPESKRIAPVLEELRRQRTLMAVVVDDDGATVGLVTLEDLLEELVGDIQDEYDTEEPPLRVLAPGRIACQGGVMAREFTRFWNKSFESEPSLGRATLRDADGEDADDSLSIAALALHLFDGVPQEGDRAVIGILAPERKNESRSESRSENKSEAKSENRGDGKIESKAENKNERWMQIEIARMDGPRIAEVVISSQSAKGSKQ